jgi:hypothetical protein
MDNLTELAFALADESAVELIRAGAQHEMHGFEPWMNVGVTVKNGNRRQPLTTVLDREIRYAEARGLLRRHPDPFFSNLVQFVEA